MRHKPVIPRQRAHQDVEDTLGYYVNEASAEIALAFVDALQAAYAHISHHPASGSPRYGHELDLPGLRCWRLSDFPYLIFYIEQTSHIDVWRVLHGQRDIPGWLNAPD
ncbi:type II toxin-antitoxin system RelE/ParE family toxin [Ferrovibrio sp.]|uniref:type II toxin-antitoxin system RelE/ParE family toxin n=1 Tax=Ferrovibrio sp. TaxID=1917215 RepID=UPI0025C36DF9|nr:type II toxin-antitoxin system RelE/ParE family toxin [Ferrovibrio sp.]MBX3456617.1 type II toxin-antitoxin system RelE/ParE family toxin [Ferrovibrio sp.]